MPQVREHRSTMETAVAHTSTPAPEHDADTVSRTPGTSFARSVRSEWQSALDRAHRWVPPAERSMVVVVPHPDDEVLIAGGLIARQRDRGVTVRIVAVTNGEAAYDSESTRDEDRRSLAAQRRREQLAALEGLGVCRSAVDRLGIPDGTVGKHVDDLADWIADEYRDHLVVAPWIHDHHPDHEACGRAATAAATRGGGHRLIYGFFWTWHHVDPSTVDGAQLRRLQLSKRAQQQRMRAITHHRSQLERPGGHPVLTEPLLEPVWWNDEFYIEATPTDRRHDVTAQARPVTS